MRTDLQAFVIAISNKTRSPNLIYDLKTSKGISNVTLVPAITPKNVDKLLLDRVLTRSKILLGRRVSPIEGCISLSHHKAYRLAFAEGNEFNLFCEDDVVIKNNGIFEMVFNSISSSQVPRIWTFHSPEWAVWKMKEKEFQSKFPPPFASCYIMNLAALTLALKSEVIGVADWPIWSKKVLFTLIRNSEISVIQNLSDTELERKIAKKSRTKVPSLIYPRLLKTIPLTDRVKHIIYYPLLWKFYKGLRNFKWNSNNDSVFLD